MCLLFFEVFINLGVVSDQLWVCFDRGELSWNGGQSNPPKGEKAEESGPLVSTRTHKSL